MTNAEKFEKVFGIKPDLEFIPIECPQDDCTNCEYNYRDDDGWANCGNWWDKEYINPPIKDVLTISTLEKETTIPTLVSKDAPHQISIFSCPHILPCGWCEKRDMLCNQKGV